MKKMILATHNKDKLREVSEIFSDWQVSGENPDVEETEMTFKGNALLKARAVHERNPDAYVIADDSGLEVDALDGAPGVFSARYAGEDGNNQANNDLLLKNMAGIENRKAHYTCAMALITPEGKEIVCEGYCYGTIATSEIGTGGFGYDPLFIPDGYSETFGIISAEEKNKFSHRSKALAEIRRQLNSEL